jgi:peptide deformylase
VTTVVNPEITKRSRSTEIADEGCLSLQGVLVPVERSSRVVVEAKDPQGEDVRLELEDLGARVAQHELDHLDGVLIIDRTTDDARREALSVLRPRIVLT